MKDEGFATVAVLALCGVLASAGGLVSVLGGIAVARHQAAAAADLAALAGAARAIEGPRPACTAAAGVARRNGAVLVSCDLNGLDVAVTVAVRPPGVVGTWGNTQGHARAGPGTSTGSEASYRDTG